MSNINEVSTIDTAYPVPGKDNNSEGFRANFQAIQDKFVTADTEITLLQSTTVKTADGTSPATNDLNTSTLSNGQYSQFNGVYVLRGSVGSGSNLTDAINLNLGPAQQWNVEGNTVLTFPSTVLGSDNWIPDQFSVVKLIFKGVAASSVVTINAENINAHIKTASGWAGGTNPVTVTVTSGQVKVIEAWSTDGGVTIYLRELGTW